MCRDWPKRRLETAVEWERGNRGKSEGKRQGIHVSLSWEVSKVPIFFMYTRFLSLPYHLYYRTNQSMPILVASYHLSSLHTYIHQPLVILVVDITLLFILRPIPTLISYLINIHFLFIFIILLVTEGYEYEYVTYQSFITYTIIPFPILTRFFLV